MLVDNLKIIIQKDVIIFYNSIKIAELYDNNDMRFSWINIRQTLT
jgi:hypothetical protein